MRRKAISFVVAMTALNIGAEPRAANDLDSFLNKRPIGCVPVNLDQYRRTVAVCSVGGVARGLLLFGIDDAQHL
jgi:hypothetical protein